MASTALVTKQLGDLLQKQQEPFALEIYLIERGYPKNKFNLEHNTSSKFLKKKKIIPNCSKAVRALFNKLGSFNPRVKDGGTKKRVPSSQESAEENPFSSGSNKTGFNSCTESATEEDRYISSHKGQNINGNLLGENEVDTDIKMKRRILEDNMQLSPVSVLEGTEFSENSPIHNRGQRSKTIHEEIPSNSIFSDSCKLLEPLKIKLALQQTELLVGCEKEAVETHRWTNIWQQQFREFLGAEEIGKVVCDNIWEWSKKSVHVTNTKQLLDLDLLASAEEWSYFEQQRKGIGMEIAGAILEDISCEIVMDMV